MRNLQPILAREKAIVTNKILKPKLVDNSDLYTNYSTSKHASSHFLYSLNIPKKKSLSEIIDSNIPKWRPSQGVPHKLHKSSTMEEQLTEIGLKYLKAHRYDEPAIKKLNYLYTVMVQKNKIHLDIADIPARQKIEVISKFLVSHDKELNIKKNLFSVIPSLTQEQKDKILLRRFRRFLEIFNDTDKVS